jgi:hypothetical protein
MPSYPEYSKITMGKKRTSKKRGGTGTQLESIRHKDKRKNIPTEELRDFVVDDEQAPKKLLYPRDPFARSAACVEGEG